LARPALPYRDPKRLVSLNATSDLRISRSFAGIFRACRQLFTGAPRDTCRPIIVLRYE
jgi:hypothetical protein